MNTPPTLCSFGRGLFSIRRPSQKNEGGLGDAIGHNLGSGRGERANLGWGPCIAKDGVVPRFFTDKTITNGGKSEDGGKIRWSGFGGKQLGVVSALFVKKSSYQCHVNKYEAIF
jgi:hypothetical protein